MSNEEITVLKLSDIKGPAKNVRKTFNKDSLQELADSIKEVGVITPVVVRASNNGKEPYELVTGERRLRAAKLAGLDKIPARFMDVVEADLDLVQVTENLQREDLHPLEEAKGYAEIRRTHGVGTDELTSMVAKSKTYVTQRIQLNKLVPAAVELFRKGTINLTGALAIARIPDKGNQEEMVKEMKKHPSWYDTTDALKRKIESEYMLYLKDAPFNIREEALIERGSCIKCVDRTKNQALLFPDMGKEDKCLNPKCFDAKRTANTKKMLAAASGRGIEIVEKAPFTYGNLSGSTRFIEADRAYYWYPGDVTLEKLLTKQKVKKYGTVDDKGRFRILFSKEATKKALKAAKVKISYGPFETGATVSKADRQKKMRTNRIDKLTRQQIEPAVILNVSKIKKLNDKCLRAVAIELCEHSGMIYQKGAVDRDIVQGITGMKGDLQSIVHKAKADKLPSVIMAMLAGNMEKDGGLRVDIYTAIGMNYDAARRHATREVDQEIKDKEAKTASKKPGKNKGARKVKAKK